MARNRYKSRREGRRIPGFVKFTAFVILACAAWVALNIGAAPEYLNALSGRNKVRSEVEALEKRIQDLEREQAQVESRGFADERAAREKYYLARPGEKVIILEVE